MLFIALLFKSSIMNMSINHQYVNLPRKSQGVVLPLLIPLPAEALGYIGYFNI